MKKGKINMEKTQDTYAWVIEHNGNIIGSYICKKDAESEMKKYAENLTRKYGIGFKCVPKEIDEGYAIMKDEWAHEHIWLKIKKIEIKTQMIIAKSLDIRI